MRILQSLFFLLLTFLCSCDNDLVLKKQGIQKGSSVIVESNLEAGRGALLASRIKSLDELKSIVLIEYYNESGREDSLIKEKSMVRLKHKSGGMEIISELRSGVSQDDISEAKDGDFFDRLGLLIHSPYAVSNRMELSKIYSLARRKSVLFGEGDVAFYDLAQASAENINTIELAYKNPRDSSEKGYINTFNHFIAQSIITSLYSEEIADFIADVHELHNMPTLPKGVFTIEELKSLTNNPIDNYVDIINNEWGQEMGKRLKKKYNINQSVIWTPELLADYLNEIQHYFSWSFQIGFRPFLPEEELIRRFSKKINLVLEGGIPVEWEQ